MELKMRCADCGAIGLCRHIFGRYWPDRSNNGQGCNLPSGTAHRPCGCGHRSFSNSKTKEKTRCKTKTR